MSDKQNSTLEEEREPLSKSWIFAGIVLFPLIPFVLIYFNKHIKKKMKIFLGIVYFVFLFGVYQYACVAQGPVLSSVVIPDQYVTVKQGETYQIHYKTDPQKREFDSCLQFFTNQIAQNVDYINAFEFFYCQIR